MLRLLRFTAILLFVLSSAACRDNGSSTASRTAAKPKATTTSSKDVKKKKKKADDEESTGSVKEDPAEDSRDEIKGPPASAMLPTSSLSWDGDKIEGTPTLNLAPME